MLNYRAVLSDTKKKNELLDWMMKKSGKKEPQKSGAARVKQAGEFDEMELL